MNKILSIAAALVLTASPALAVDCGIRGGIGWANIQAPEDDDSPITDKKLLQVAKPGNDWTPALSSSHVAPFVQAECDQNLIDGWLIGIWARHTWHNPDKDIDTVLDFDREWSLGARLGYKIVPQTLIYGLAGYTQGHTDVTNEEVWNISFDAPQLKGWVIGAGVDVEVFPDVTIGAEYRYATYNDTLTIPQAGSFNLDSDAHSVMISAKYKLITVGQ